MGASHLLRIATGLSTKNATGFAIARNLQQVGGNLSCTSDREVVAYNVEVTRDKLETGLKFLEAAVTGQVFKPWELGDNAHRVKEDIKRVSDCVKAIELVHEASFAGGLGNSIFCPKHNAGKLSTETLQHYFASTCTANRCAVVGVGIDHQILVGYAQSLGLDTGAGPEHATNYVGPSEIRWDKGGNTASVAVATQGAGWKDQKEALAHAVLQYAAGVGPHTKRGANNGALTKQIGGCAAAKTLNACYSDTGLFGFVVSGEAKAVGQVNYNQTHIKSFLTHTFPLHRQLNPVSKPSNLAPCPMTMLIAVRRHLRQLLLSLWKQRPVSLMFWDNKPQFWVLFKV